MDPVTEKVFTNTVVWRRLGNCLNFSDLKDLRLVCRNFNQTVIENTTFKNRALVHVSIDRIVKRNEFRTTTIQWKHIKIGIASNVELQEKLEEEKGEVEEVREDAVHWIYSKLQAVESLVLYGKNLTGNSPIVFNYPSIVKILEASENLTALTIDVNILNETGNAKLFANPSEKFIKTLRNLVEFRIFSPHYGILASGQNSDFSDSISWIGKNLRSIQVMNIGRLAIEDTNSDNSIFDYELFLKIQNLLQVIASNKNKITKLLLDDQILWMTNPDLHAITKTVFPALKCVSIRMMHDTSDLKNLINFISREPLLEEINLTYLKHLPKEFVSVIQSKSTNLKKLRIKTKAIIKESQSVEQDNVVVEEEEANAGQQEDDMWNFLSGLTNLEEFELELLLTREAHPLASAQSYKKVLTNLPSSIKIISLSGFPYLDNGFITGLDFNNLKPLNITQLILKKCPDAVNNETMEFICRNLKMLQTLHISKSSTLTDYGITGIGELNKTEDSEFSIKDLKGLKSLTIRRCSGISDSSCRAIQFQELAYLDISHNERVTPTGIMQILSSNPSLETLKTAEFEELPPENELLAKFPRLKIHTFSYDGESESEDDSNIDGSSVSGFGPRFHDDDFDDDFGECDEDDDFDDDVDDEEEDDY